MVSARTAERWARIRGRGRRDYVLRYGVIFWGGITAVLFHLTDLWWQEMWEVRPGRLALRLVLFGLGGIWVGHSMWRSNESKFSEHQRASNPGVAQP